MGLPWPIFQNHNGPLLGNHDSASMAAGSGPSKVLHRLNVKRLVQIFMSDTCHTKQRALFCKRTGSNDCGDKRSFPYFSAAETVKYGYPYCCVVPFCKGTRKVKKKHKRLTLLNGFSFLVNFLLFFFILNISETTRDRAIVTIERQ